jgi:flavin-dependent dehydrogenase
MPRRETHDVIVVGAHTAGAATAMLLARAGVRTLLVDDGDPSSHPPPTPALLRGGVLQLSRWGLLAAVVAAGTPPVRRTTLRYGDETVIISLRPSPGVDALYAPRSSVLDPLLVQSAVDAGAAVDLRSSMADLVVRDGRVAGVRIVTADGDGVDVGGQLVIGADGIRSRIAQQVGATFSRVGQHAGAMTYAYWPDVTTDGFEWSLHPNACSGVIPTDGGVACVFASATPARIGDGGVDVIREVVAEGAPSLARRLQDAPAPVDARTWHGHHGFIRRSHGRGWALVGDAGYFQDPIGLHGLTDALRDAELLASAVCDGLGDDRSMDGALGEYELVRDRLSVPRFDVVDRIASHQWDGSEMARLQLQLSSALADEADVLAALEAESAV